MKKGSHIFQELFPVVCVPHAPAARAMKLQKQVAYKYKEKTHYKYVLIIPQDTITELGWQEGQELEIEIDHPRLIIT